MRPRLAVVVLAVVLAGCSPSGVRESGNRLGDPVAHAEAAWYADCYDRIEDHAECLVLLVEEFAPTTSTTSTSTTTTTVPDSKVVADAISAIERLEKATDTWAEQTNTATQRALAKARDRVIEVRHGIESMKTHTTAGLRCCYEGSTAKANERTAALNILDAGLAATDEVLRSKGMFE